MDSHCRGAEILVLLQRRQCETGARLEKNAVPLSRMQIVCGLDSQRQGSSQRTNRSTRTHLLRMNRRCQASVPRSGYYQTVGCLQGVCEPPPGVPSQLLPPPRPCADSVAGPGLQPHAPGPQQLPDDLPNGPAKVKPHVRASSDPQHVLAEAAMPASTFVRYWHQAALAIAAHH